MSDRELNLAGFLRERLDEDQRVAREIPDTRPTSPPPTRWQRARAWVRGKVREARWRLAAKIGGMSREVVEEESWLW